MYTVIVLAEQAMSPGDAAEVASLHDGIEEPRHYHVLIPFDAAADRVEAAMGALASESMAGTPITATDVDVELIQGEIDEQAKTAVGRSVAALRALGHQASGEFTTLDPIDALEQAGREREAAEAIVMTRPHVIAEMLHLDWAHKARRRLGIPILHLVEHEPLDGEAGAGEGVTGM